MAVASGVMVWPLTKIGGTTMMDMAERPNEAKVGRRHSISWWAVAIQINVASERIASIPLRKKGNGTRRVL